MRTIKVVIAGYGLVGRALTDLILENRQELAERSDLHFSVVAAADLQGAALYAEGFPLSKLHTIAWDTGSVAYYPDYGSKGLTALEAIELSGANMLVESTYTNLEHGEPARTHVLQAMALGMDVVLANKGPLALYDQELRQAAARYGVGLAYSCASSAGLEILPLVGSLGQAGELLAIRGIFNATSQYILEQMAAGVGYAEALAAAQKGGFAEADPTLDVGGFDSAVKLLHMSNHAWGLGYTIRQVAVTGIQELTPAMLQEAKQHNESYSLVAEARWQHDQLQLKVAPARLPASDPLAGLSYQRKAAVLECRTQGKQLLLSLSGGRAGLAGSVLADMVRLVRER